MPTRVPTERFPSCSAKEVVMTAQCLSLRCGAASRRTGGPPGSTAPARATPGQTPHAPVVGRAGVDSVASQPRAAGTRCPGANRAWRHHGHTYDGPEASPIAARSEVCRPTAPSRRINRRGEAELGCRSIARHSGNFGSTASKPGMSPTADRLPTNCRPTRWERTRLADDQHGPRIRERS